MTTTTTTNGSPSNTNTNVNGAPKAPPPLDTSTLLIPQKHKPGCPKGSSKKTNNVILFIESGLGAGAGMGMAVGMGVVVPKVKRHVGRLRKEDGTAALVTISIHPLAEDQHKKGRKVVRVDRNAVNILSSEGLRRLSKPLVMPPPMVHLLVILQKVLHQQRWLLACPGPKHSLCQLSWLLQSLHSYWVPSCSHFFLPQILSMSYVF
jgi:hypothetical protein